MSNWRENSTNCEWNVWTCVKSCTIKEEGTKECERIPSLAMHYNEWKEGTFFCFNFFCFDLVSLHYHQEALGHSM
jgi:hypothetical protein